MAVDTSKLVNLVARGLPNTQIANALGITPGRLTQILALEQIQELINFRKEELATEEIETITSLETVSKGLLEQIQNLVEESDSLGEVVRAFDTIEKIRSTKQGTGHKTAEELDVITTTIPIFVQQNLQINVNKVNEIIDIGNRSMTTMPTSGVQKLIKAHTQPKKVIEHEYTRTDNLSSADEAEEDLSQVDF